MTIFTAMYLSAYASTALAVWRWGDRQDVAMMASIAMAIALTYAAVPWLAKPVFVIGGIWALHAVTVLWFATRFAHECVGALSGLIVILAGLALVGWLPSQTGQGIATNFYHFSTVATWLQLAAIGVGLAFRDAVAD